MALKKKRVGPLSKKQVISKKKKAPVQKGSLKKSIPKKPVLSEVTDLYERARWKKERREYWRNRFRKILAGVPLQSKAKK
jgi:hypothetical protein